MTETNDVTRPEPPSGYVLRFGGGMEIPVQDDGEKAEDASLGDSPPFLERLAEARRDLDQGRGFSTDQVEALLAEASEADHALRPERSSGTLRVRISPA